MARITHQKAGRCVALEDSRWSLRIDRGEGTLTYVEQPLIGRSRERTVALDRIRGVEFEISNVPDVSLDLIKDLFQQVLAMPNPSAVDPQERLSRLPQSARVRVDEEGATGTRMEIRVSLDSSPPAGRGDAAWVYVSLAVRMAAAAGLPYALVSVIPHTATYVELARERLEGAVAVPTGEDVGDADLDRAAARAFEHAGVPPFDARRFSCDHKLTTWEPSTRIEFHRHLSPSAFIVLPLALLVFAGPAVVAVSLANGTPVDRVWAGVATVFGLVAGGIALLIGSFLMPRTVVVDWDTRTIAIRTWRRTIHVAFDELERLELEGIHHKSSGGESGSESSTYSCALHAVRRRSDGTVDLHELLTTRSERSPNEPYRQAVPLLTDLAAALRVEGRVLEYPFRRRAA